MKSLEKERYKEIMVKFRDITEAEGRKSCSLELRVRQFKNILELF